MGGVNRTECGMRRQINEYELAYLYNKIGASIWHLQYVENALVPYIIVKGVAKELNSLPEKEAFKHEAELNKLTLGQLIGKAAKLDVFDEKFLGRLRGFNNERKWIVHNSIFEHGDTLYTDEGRNFVFSRFDGFVEEAISLHKQIGDLMVEYCVSKGMSKKDISQVAIDQIKKLKGEV